MEKRRFMKENKGYSLVEMIIVMAIIVIMTGAAMVTITIMHSAKAKEASITLETALSDVQQSAKGKMCVVSGTQEPDYRYALVVYQTGGKYYVKKGYYIGNGSDVNDHNNYVFVDAENANSGKGECFSAYVDVKYVNPSGIEQDIGSIDSNDGVYIIYDKQGMCIQGDGQYKFYKNKKDVLISTVELNKNGSHTLR